jgi:sigma-B regulation protein RsbU (phosphoserine phosphatase)
VGGVLLGAKETETDYTTEDLNLLRDLAAQLAISLQNGLLLRDRVAVARFEEELNLARQIQRSFLPSHFPEMERVDLYAMTIPSKEVGGDLYDFVPTGDGTYLLAIADVSGKGVPAALLSSMLQASLRTQAGTGSTVAEILRNINNLVYRSTAMEQFATFFLAQLDETRLHLDFSNAGHNYPLLFRSSGEMVELEKGGLILGIVDGADFEEEGHALTGGDRVIFYTDGVSEARNAEDEEFGEERLADLIRSFPLDLTAEEVVEGILEEFYSFLGDEEAQDDVTLMVLQVKERVSQAGEETAVIRESAKVEAGKKD